MKNDCKIVQDLLPNYIEKVTSKETNEYIEEHMKICEDCTKIYNEMNKDLNIETPNNEMEVNYMKKFNGEIKKLKIWKKILIVIATLLIILLGIVMYRSFILTKIWNLQSKVNEIPNIYYTITHDDNLPMKIWKKENLVKKVCDGSGIEWRDYTLGEGLWVIEKSKKYCELDKDNPIGYISLAGGMIMRNMLDYDFMEILKMSLDLDMTIGTKEYNGKKCYWIKLNDEDYKYPGEEIYDKETGLLLYDSASAGKNFNKETKQWVNIVTKYEYKLNVVTDEDVAKPDVTGYEIMENK